ncbi:MAG TPA: rhodanese-like domain-containing protein [bacterium]|nr:rhodanese-like domain-containing protein [bacterium]
MNRFSFSRFSPDSFPLQDILRQAWGLFVFSSFFAVLFNAFYMDGIDLKFKPRVEHSWHPTEAPNYPGLSSSSPTPPSKKTTPSSLPDKSDSFPRLSLMGVKERFDKKACVFLDARKPEEYQDGHIPGALNFYGNEPEKFAPLVMPQIPDKTREIIAYCHGGDCDLSLQTAKALREAGYTHVEIFTGGWPDWQKAGYPVTKGEEP